MLWPHAASRGHVCPKSRPGRSRSKDSPVGNPQNFWDGLKCGLAGVNTTTPGLEPWDQNCADAQITTWVYIGTVCVFNMLMLWIIKNGTVVLYFIANALSIPLISVISATRLYPSVGLPQDVFTAWQIIGLLVVVIGTALYRSVPEQMRHPEGDFEFYDDEAEGDEHMGGYHYLDGRESSYGRGYDDSVLSASEFYKRTTSEEIAAVTHLSSR